MVRYNAEHKRVSRERIVRAAARLFRRHGYDGVGIDTVMAEAGLTRGGFYGHFRSKTALYRAVLEHEHDFIARLAAREGRTRTELANQGVAIADAYLDPAHRAQVLKGCSLAALAIDSSRAEAATRKAYAAAVRALHNELCRGLDAPQTLDPRALGAIVVCIGGLLVQGASSADRELADALAGAARGLVADLLR